MLSCHQKMWTFKAVFCESLHIVMWLTVNSIVIRITHCELWIVGVWSSVHKQLGKFLSPQNTFCVCECLKMCYVKTDCSVNQCRIVMWITVAGVWSSVREQLGAGVPPEDALGRQVLHVSAVWPRLWSDPRPALPRRQSCRPSDPHVLMPLVPQDLWHVRHCSASCQGLSLADLHLPGLWKDFSAPRQAEAASPATLDTPRVHVWDLWATV